MFLMSLNMSTQHLFFEVGMEGGGVEVAMAMAKVMPCCRERQEEV